MHPDIAGLIARRFYSGRLVTGADVEQSCTTISAGPPQSGRAVVLVDTAALQPFGDKEAREQHVAARRFGGNSRFNLVSAIIAVEMALVATPPSQQETHAVSAGIITPYAAQARLIAKLLHDLDVPRERVMCSTVHRFQGSERDVIVYDTVEGKPFTHAGMLLAGDGSRLEARLLNVALSRAKGKLIILADLAHLRSVLPTNNIYQQILTDLEQHVRPLRLAHRSRLDSGIAVMAPLPGITCFPAIATSQGRAVREQLADDLHVAEIVAVAGEPQASATATALSSALSASVCSPQARVYVGSKTLSPVAAQEQRWIGPELPCLAIGIDQNILWLEGKGYVLRITHPQTVKLLYSLWDLLPESMRALKTTAQQRELASHGQSPLGRACTKCGAEMWVSDQYGHVATLKCMNTACGHSVSFTPAVATQWADLNSATCPQCGGQMEGRRGQYGVYLRCMSYPKCKGSKRLTNLI
ncbi:MAG: AAA domain-containing protein [Ktedonobacterales bacterium]